MSRFAQKTLVLLLALCLLWLPAAAVGNDPATVVRADRLVSLHVFRGTGTNEDGSPIYNLQNQPTRLQGLIMLIRLLGLEDTALAYDGPNPFSDMSGRFAPLAAFAYANGITNGTSATMFTPGAALSARAYVTFLLRALGYTETDGDFAWGGQTAFAASLGMMTERTAATIEAAPMDRGELVDLSYAAMFCRVKDRNQTLAEKLSSDGVFTWAEGENAGVLGENALWTFDFVPPEPESEPDSPSEEPESESDSPFSETPDESATPSDNPADPPSESPAAPVDTSTVLYEAKKISTDAGAVTAHILTVNTGNPKVRVKSAMVDNTLGHTDTFSSIVKESGALAVINGNFFNSYSKFQTPIGHVMVNGEFLFGNSGISSLGITEDGEVRIGRPPLFTRLRSGQNQWSVYEINTADQDSSASVLYTPAYGSAVTFKNGGLALIVRDGVIRDFYSASAGLEISIPADGYTVFMGSAYIATDYFRMPVIGEPVSMEYYLAKEGRAVQEDDEGFTLDGVTSMISGAPRLVKDGQIVTDLEPGFTEARFTTAVSPRTAVGINEDGKLLLVCVPDGASIQQMREIMLALDCVDAFNLDGGASCGMYYNGDYIAMPGRELTVTLQVFVYE